MHQVYEPIEYNYEEECARCRSTIQIMIDFDDYEHYQVTCPVCGEQMMLCTLCRTHANEQKEVWRQCDWKEEEKTCYRKKENNNEKTS